MTSDPSAPSLDLPWPALVARAAHDMRTPLSSIYTTLAVLRMVSSSDKAADLIDRLERQAGELKEMVDRLVDEPGTYVLSEEKKGEVC